LGLKIAFMKYKAWLILYLLFSAQFLQAQTDSLSIRPKEFIVEDSLSRIWFGIEGGLERCDRTVKTNDRYYASRNNFTNADKRTPGNGFHMGASLYYDYSPKWKLETGVHYFTNLYHIEKFNLPFLLHDPNTGKDSVVYSDLRYTYYQVYFYIPLHLKYILLDRPRLKLYVSAGTGLQFLMLNADDKDYQGVNSGYRLSYNPFVLSWYAGFGAFYDLGSHLLLKLEPGIRGNLTSVTHKPDRTALYNSMISLGLVYTAKY
jgi:hypothetical protein